MALIDKVNNIVEKYCGERFVHCRGRMPRGRGIGPGTCRSALREIEERDKRMQAEEKNE